MYACMYACIAACMRACMYLCMHSVRMYVCIYVCLYLLWEILSQVGGFCPGVYVRGVCPFPRRVSTSSLCSLKQVSFVFIINFYFATAYSVQAYGMMTVAYFSYRCGASHLRVFYVFYSWGQRFLDLCIKWNTVKSASVLAAGQISPYALSSQVDPRGRPIAPCMQGLLLQALG